MSTKWRILSLQENDAFMNMALDEAISNSVALDLSPPTIRFYTWKPSAVSIGYFQSILDEINIDACKNSKVDCIRRRTGGGAVYHDIGGEITYSVIAPEKIMPKGITESYHLICGWIVESLKLLEIKSEFKPINDIITNDGKKISGNAQTRRNGVLLQHGTILYEVDVEKMFSLLKVGQAKIADKLISNVKQRVTSIKNIDPSITKEGLYLALLKGFSLNKEHFFGELTSKEIEDAKNLVENRYKTKEWNFMR